MAGREIRYVDLPASELTKRLVALGVPVAFAGDVASLFADVAGSRLEATTPDVAELTGRPARTFDEFLAAETDAVRRVWASEVHSFQ